MEDEITHDIANEMYIKSEEQMLQFVTALHYLVVFPDGSKHFYKSLREIGNAIGIDYTTISKKLGGNKSCICIAKNVGYPFWVKKL